MRQQSKPFIVEIKQSRKTRTNERRPSIWGALDLKPEVDQLQNLTLERVHREVAVAAGDNDRR